MHKIVLVYALTCLALGHCRLIQAASSNDTLTLLEQRHIETSGGTVLDGYYFLGTERLSWFEAHLFCVSHGWKLLSINTACDQVNIEGFLRYYDNHRKDYWIGGNRLSDLKGWHWGMCGDKFMYTNWAPGEPNNLGGKEYCVHLNANSLNWNDHDCEVEYEFICQKLPICQT